MNWQPLYIQTRLTRLVPHPENDSQPRVNDFCSCIRGNIHGDWMQMIITDVLAVLQLETERDMAPCPILHMSVNAVSTIFVLAGWLIKVRDSHKGLYMEFWLVLCDKMFRITELHHWKWIELWLSGRLSWDDLSLSPQTGCQNLVYRCLRSFTTKITRDSIPTIIVALLMLSVKMTQGECSILFCLKRRLVQRLYITMIKSHCINLTSRTNNH